MIINLFKLIKKLVRTYQWKLYKFSFGKHFIDKMNKLFATHHTLGILSYKTD